MMNLQYDDAEVRRNQQSLKVLHRAISFSQGQFSLILARCNYASLRDRVTADLHDSVSVEIRELHLPTSVRTLYKTIQDEIGTEQPQALMVFGLESVSHLDSLFMAANQVREEFRKHFPFPIVFWVDDRVLKSFIRVAPDFESWATSTEFSLSTTAAIETIAISVDRVFSEVVELGSLNFIPNSTILGPRNCLELEFAKQELSDRQVQLVPELEASLHFVLGRDDYASDRLDLALKRYHQSLAFWQQQIPDSSSYSGEKDAIAWGECQSRPFIPLTGAPSPLIWEMPPLRYYLQQGVVLFHIGLCYCRLAQLAQPQEQQHLQQARSYLEDCVRVFEESRHPELVAKFIGQLGEILQRLQAWDALSIVAKKSITLHQQGKPQELARDYGFLAEVALQQSQWEKARNFAERALEVLSHAPKVLIPRPDGLYLLLLARAFAQLGQGEQAIAHLHRAEKQTDPQYDLQLYRRILEELRSLYFHQSEYLSAFEIKQKLRAIEAQFGLRAFIGAGRLQARLHTLNPSMMVSVPPTHVPVEIATSGREGDVNRLIERLGRNDYRLTVIHGHSGVGKSSLVQAGLVPVLKQTAIAARNAFPVLLQVYTDWVTGLKQGIQRGLEESGFDRDDSGRLTGKRTSSLDFNANQFSENVQELLEELHRNNERNLLTVLIFDQFEEFFFVETDPGQRQQFYQFLNACVNVPFVKVIFSLREDYLHYLLECERLGNLEVVDQDILNKKFRYYLGNLSQAKARQVIESLTERAQFYLEPALIEELVEDLADRVGEVRPIELQVVGAQLQAENITTLAQYRESGPKEKLVQRFLEEAIADCGPENEYTARLLLYFLTEESGIRPLKKQAELLADLTPELAVHPDNLEEILKILEKAGLVFVLPELPESRYQLVHDYLVKFIREQDRIQAGLKGLRKKNKELQATNLKLYEENQVQAELTQSKEKAKQMQTTLNWILAIMVAGFGLLSWQTFSKSLKAEIAELEAKNLSSEALRLKNNEFGALVNSIQVGQKTSEIMRSPLSLEMQTASVLQLAYTVREINRLEHHKNSVVSVTFSNDGELIATASTDKTVKLFTAEGDLLWTLNGHKKPVTRVAFSPDGQTIASTSTDRTIKLWQRDGTLIRTLTGHSLGVTSASFSPDGQIIASSSLDRTIKLWNLQGQLLRTINTENAAILFVRFDPDGQTIAAASLDNTVKLWDTNGNAIGTFTGHEQGVTSVSFSPDGQTLASGSIDKTVKLWRRNGTEIATLRGHTETVLGVNFSPDGTTVASASVDRTAKLWRQDPETNQWVESDTLQGHRDEVWSVSFSPDGQTIATASLDNTVKLWKSVPRQLPGFREHTDEVLVVAFSPNGRVLASASKDNTVMLWEPNGRKIADLKGHEDAVWNLSFSPDGELFATASADNTVKLWSKSKQDLVATLEGHQDRVLGIDFSPDGQQVISGSGDGMVILWSKTGERLRTFRADENSLNSVTFSPDGKRIATAGGDTVKLWNLEGKLVRSIGEHQGEVYSVTFSPDGEQIATASQDKTVKIWSKDGRAIATLEGHIRSVYWVTYSPNGQLIATASEDKTVKLWTKDGKAIATLEGHNDAVLSLSFSPDSKTLASSSKDKTVILWNLNLEDLLTRSCLWVDDYLANNSRVREGDRAVCDEILGEKKEGFELWGNGE
ncbi:AAA family ATPase [Phormidium pseudopriestleyi FRX01]|uniref:AAA family ATPase n=1 Tax=Phormidium pseudopriestleyi FRX01 TaxID=1759528 RepID=A0ABS3FM16_9CYAN|nr:AAA family ATPase [Phormidium pseudopriestleyi]MBO0347942.1 AAA family ATPase [Phormidium pseudopriestleyi FRX01]